MRDKYLIYLTYKEFVPIHKKEKTQKENRQRTEIALDLTQQVGSSHEDNNKMSFTTLTLACLRRSEGTTLEDPHVQRPCGGNELLCWKDMKSWWGWSIWKKGELRGPQGTAL